MKNVIKIMILLSYSLISFGQTEFKVYDFSDYNFTIDFPQKPDFSIDSSTFNKSPINTYLWEVKVNDSLHLNNYYSISFMSLPSDYIHSDSLFSVVDGLINSTQNQILNDKTYTLLSSVLIEKNGYPGKNFRWKNNSTDVFFEFDVFLIQNRLFQLSVISKKGKNHNKFVNEYFNSFNLVNIEDGKFKIPFVSKERTYSIEFPSDPTNESKIVDSEFGRLFLDIQTADHKNKENSMVYYVSSETKYPTKVVDQTNAYELNRFYQNSIKASITSVNGEIISINDIYIDNKHGKEYRCYLSEWEMLMIYRILYFNESMYSFGVMTDSNNDNNKQIENFFNSFRLKN